MTEHLKQANDLLKNIVSNQQEKGAKRTTVKIGGVDVTVLTFPKKKDQLHAHKVSG